MRRLGEGEGTWLGHVLEHVSIGLEAARVGLALLQHLLPPELRPADAPADFDWEREHDDFIRYAQRRAFGPSTASLVKAAEERGIPWLRLNRYCLVQMGHGKYQRRIQAALTGETRHIAVELASDKEETNKLLGDLGLPVPRQRQVHDENEAARAAESIGYPVVVKPLDANHGRASRSTSRPPRRCAGRSTRRTSTRARCWSRVSSRARTTGCWS